MKRTHVSLLAFALVLAIAMPSSAQFFNRLKQAAKDKAEQVTGDANTPAPAPAPTPAPAPAPAPAPTASSNPTPATSSAGTSASTAAPAPIAAYQNYDFTPGKTIIFADDFTATQDGEFPNQWELISGQGAVNKQQGFETFTLTDGNYVRVSPRMKTKTYLGKSYTLEFDAFPNGGDGDAVIALEQGSNEALISTEGSDVSYHSDQVHLTGSLPAAISGDNYYNHWHHIAIAVKNDQLKVYVDQYRVLVVPDMKFSAQSLEFAGVASQDKPIIFTNVRLASGGGMNLIGQKFTAAKIVTHGINFDVDKATLRPESMGTLNQIKRLMEANPDLKFQVGGYTDNSGSAAHNLTLSQQRAEAVVKQLETMGIAASRLTAKGYGDANPISPNDTPEGKANNRRVEFVRVT